MPQPTDTYRTTVGVTFWTGTVQEADAKINAITNVSGADDAVLSTMEFHPDGPPQAPDAPPVAEQRPTTPEAQPLDENGAK